MKDTEIAITGGKGKIGTILRSGLTDYKIRSIDLPWVDLRKYEHAKRSLKGMSTVIHLAWDAPAENHHSDKCSINNTAMAVNVYRASLENRLSRIVVASSVHADDFVNWPGRSDLVARWPGTPSTAYGKHKSMIELMGQIHSLSGLEVICIRFGGINSELEIPPESVPQERCVFLSHADCVTIVRSILEDPIQPRRFCIINAVSDIPERKHDVSNPFGWASAPRQCCAQPPQNVQVRL